VHVGVLHDLMTMCCRVDFVGVGNVATMLLDFSAWHPFKSTHYPVQGCQVLHASMVPLLCW